MESIMFRIMNVKALHQLEDEIEQMEDAQEREIRTQLIERIMEKITDYDVHVREYAYKQSIKNLLDRGIVIEPAEKAPVIDLWDQQIDSLVSIETKHSTQHYSDQFRWHLFSFELLTADQNDSARAAFNSAQKNELYLFFDFADEAYRIQNAHLLTAEDVDALRENSPLNYSDMYFFDPVSKWTYVRPHEAYCGPYYYKVGK